MVVKVYLSGISGNQEVKKRQQRVLMILDSKSVKYDVIDITEPGKETDKDFMQTNATSNGGTVSDPNPRSPLPPQIFNDDEYCGDYDQFDLANEVDTLEQFLKLEVPPEEPPQPEAQNDKDTLNGLNGDVAEETKENSQEKEISETDEAKNELETEKEKSPVKEGTPLRDATPGIDEEENPTKEKTPEKESSTERQNSAEKETPAEKEASPAKEVEEKHVSKENTPEVESINENGSVSSRNQSVEKEVVDAVERKKDSSELLIESEQAVE